MTEYYVPGLGEKDTDKTIRSLMQAHENTAANTADIATNTADIATNTANIATNTANIAAWPGTTVGQLPFPATQAPSANANTLDDYEEGTWTPTITFATPGNLSVAYSLQNGYYTKIGRLVSLSFALVTSTFTHTTASGQLFVNGLPFTPVNDANYRAYAPIIYSGITKAGYAAVSSALIGNSAPIQFLASGSGVAISLVDAADMPTGGTVVVGGSTNYVV